MKPTSFRLNDVLLSRPIMFVTDIDIPTAPTACYPHSGRLGRQELALVYPYKHLDRYNVSSSKDRIRGRSNKARTSKDGFIVYTIIALSSYCSLSLD
jgi:hypothetical protein